LDLMLDSDRSRIISICGLRDQVIPITDVTR